MRQNYSFSKNSNALLEPCEGKLSCTVLRGESPSNGADLLDTKLIYAIGAVVGLIGGRESVREILVRRSRHLQDSGKLVRSVYILDCRRHHPALILPLINNVWLNTR